MKSSGDPGLVADTNLASTLDNEVWRGLKRLQGRIAQERMSEADFMAAVGEIVALTPPDLALVDGFLIAQQVREIAQEWKARLARPLS